MSTSNGSFTSDNAAYGYEEWLCDLPGLRETDGEAEEAIDTVKIFAPDGGATWYISEYDPDTGKAFGLCYLDGGRPELGYVTVAQLREYRGSMGLPLEVDIHWDGTMEEAREELNGKGVV